MPVPKSRYKCPNCGEHQLYHPDIKGEHGWLDTKKYICFVCDKEFTTEFVKSNQPLDTCKGVRQA